MPQLWLRRDRRRISAGYAGSGEAAASQIHGGNGRETDPDDHADGG